MRLGILAVSMVGSLLAAGPALAIDYRADTGTASPGAPTANGTGTASTDYVTLLSSNAAYQSVGTFSAVNVFGIGSGVLFRTPSMPASSQYILTAAHLINGDAPNQLTWTPAGSTSTYTGVAITTATNTDLAIVQLDRVVTEVAPVTIYTGSSEVGQVGTAAGYGFGGDGQNGPSGNQGTLRAGQNAIDFKGFFTTSGNTVTFHSDPTGPYLFTDFDKPADPTFSSFGSTSPLTLESGITRGDSGGGLFATIGGQTLLVGVTDLTFTNGGPGLYGDVDAFIDVSLAQDLINSSVPEPGTIGLLFMAGGGFLLRRKRSV